MIIKELYTTRPDGVKLFLNYSDKGVYIRQDQTGIEYTEAIDVEGAPYTYTETDKPIDISEYDPGDDLTVANTLKILNEFGVDTDD